MREGDAQQAGPSAAVLHILHLEDEPADIELVRNALAADALDGHIVVVTSRPEYETALAGRNFDVILADYAIAEFHGLGALDMARARWPDIPFVFVSGRIGEERAIESLKRGAADYVLKDNLARLASTVRRVVRDAGIRASARRAEREEHETALRLQALIDSTPSLIYAVGRDGRYILANRHFKEQFASRRDDIVGLQDRDVVHPDALAVFNAHEAEVWRRGGLIEYEETIPCPEGVKIHSTYRFLLRDSSGIAYAQCSIARDVTQRRIAEEQLHQAQKMESLGKLTGGVAHDFNNILTVIAGWAEVLAEGVADRPALAAIARTIDEAAARGANLTSQLLAFARKQPLQPRHTDVNDLIADTTRFLQPTLGEHIEIVTVTKDQPCSAMVDPSLLSNALLNLAINARDAMPDGGKLTFECGNVLLDQSYIAMNPDAAPGRYVMIAVSDTGCGIPASIRERIFDPFFTTKESGRGTGLGLSMVHGFIKQSHGHIKIYSEEGHGTTIRLYLPHSSAGPAVAARAEATETLPSEGETVLVVEDDKMVRTYVLAQLASLGYATLAANDGQGALAMVDAGIPFDLLFTDVIMPGGMNGRQLADEVRKRRPAVKVLFTSGYTENAIIHHGRLDPGVVLLAKPYRIADLAQKLREALAAT